MVSSVDDFAQQAAVVIVVANVVASASRCGHPFVDVWRQVDRGVLEAQLLHAHDVVHTITTRHIRHAVDHPHDGCRWVAGIARINLRLQRQQLGLGRPRVVGVAQRGIAQGVNLVALLHPRELDHVHIVPRVGAGAIGTAVIKIVALPINDVVCASAGIDHIVANACLDVVTV